MSVDVSFELAPSPYQDHLEELLDRLELQETGAYESPRMYFGLDLAAVDGNVNPNWAKARDEGPISFAIIQANWGTWRDTNFASDWPKIKAAGTCAGRLPVPAFSVQQIRGPRKARGTGASFHPDGGQAGAK